MLDQEPLAKAPAPITIATVCSYCGKENPKQLVHCGGCGSYLSSEEFAPPKKSKGLAIFLALVFGPLGLLYVRPMLGVKMLIAGIVVFFPIMLASAKSSLFFVVAYRIFCAYLAVQNLSPEPPDIEARILLDEAAALETKDPSRAITIYEEIISRFPHTKPGKEAVRNIEVVKKLVTRKAGKLASESLR